MNPEQQIYERLLVLRFQAGDGSAFEALVERHHARLCYFINRFASNGHATDDIAQEVWLSAYRKLGTLREPAAFRTWLYHIARNRVFQERRSTRECERLPEDLPASEDSADKDTLYADHAAAIHRCLPQLSADHREALLLWFLEEMSYEEIAEVTGASIGTVRSRLHYAKRALKAKIREEDHGS
jgi:RNA polymerase sigma-70 factor (ECF subfamily)